MSSDLLFLNGEDLSVEDVADVAMGTKSVSILDKTKTLITQARAWIDQVLKDDQKTVYGVNTGFGILADVRLSPDQTRRAMRNLIVTHAVGMGEPAPEEIVRATILIRSNTLARGQSGIRVELLENLIKMLNAGVIPVVPCKGSVGASGDLAPLSHIALVLTSDPDDPEKEPGYANYAGERMSGAEAMRKAGIPRLVLEAKEGLALNNGTSYSSAYAVLALSNAFLLAKIADITCSMMMEAIKGRSSSLDPRIHQARPHPGQIHSASVMRSMLEGSTLVNGGKRLQEAYSIRCAPQVHGACRDYLSFARETLTREINSSTDNPLIFVDEMDGEGISGGNFHAEPVAFAAQSISLAAAELASISERRVFRMLDATLNGGLPSMLSRKSGLESGLMITQYTAAALVSDNKTLCGPDAADSIPTCANQEDHVSMAANAARHAYEVTSNTRKVLAIELLCAAQALDIRMEMEPDCRFGKGTSAGLNLIRQHVKGMHEDRVIMDDLTILEDLLKGDELQKAVEAAIGIEL